MNDPMVSIVIPVYNGANYIREAIDSALMQTYENVEIIVVNDGSDDDGATEQIALSYNDKIRYFAKKNGGVSTALNLAIRNMKGEYFSWLSHDDLYYPDKLKVEMDALKADGDMSAIVFSDYEVLNLSTGKNRPYRLSQQYTTQQLTSSVFSLFYGGVHGCSLLIHKSNFERVGLFDEELLTVQDYMLWFQMFRGQRLVYVPKVLVCGRIHSQQTGKRIKSKFNEEKARFYLDTAKALSKEEIEKTFGASKTFYHDIAEKLYFMGDTERYEEAIQLFQSVDSPEDYKTRQKEFYTWFGTLYGPCNRICIFGAGEYGRQLHFALAGRGINVAYFASNFSSQWGTIVEGVPCISPDELQAIKEDTLILVALQFENEILEQLKCMGCSYVSTKRILDSRLLEVVPYKIPGYALMHH